MGTVSPSLTLISLTTPAMGEGISASILSVEISNNGSSRSTASPTFFSHRTIVPSATDSPICGMTTGFGIFLIPAGYGLPFTLLPFTVCRLPLFRNPIDQRRTENGKRSTGN
jgi:hypothetical protein